MNGKLTLSLKFVVAYFFLYGLFIEYFVVNHWDEWNIAVEGKSLGYALGHLMKGPLLGVFFIISAIGLNYRRLWARKLGVVALIFSVLTEGNSFAWGFASGEPSTKILIGSYLVVLLWNGLWLGLMFKKSTTAVLQ